jgi:hypothetical protein
VAVAGAVVVVARAWVVVVVARAWVVVVVARAWVVVVVARAWVVVVVARAWVVVVVARAWVVVGSVVVLARCRQDRWPGCGAPETLLSVKEWTLARVPLSARGLTVASEGLLAARELPSTASATATTIPPARARRRRIGGAL